MHRSAWAGVVVAVARTVRDLDLAEECAQEAFAAAVDRWPVDGVSASPEGWLVTVGRRRAVEQLRRRQTLRRRLPMLLLDEADTSAQGAQEQAEERADRAREGTVEVDFVSDRLRLLFTCCHPALAPESQVALTARLVCGLTTQEAARGLLVGEATMAARITRAERKIASAGIPFRVPTGAQLPERLDVVLTVVHVLATAGRMAPAGPGVVREDLLERALELSGSLVRVMPDEAEVLGLHALVLLCAAVFGWRVLDMGGGMAMWALGAYGDHLENRTPGTRESYAAMGGPGGARPSCPRSARPWCRTPRA